MNPQNSLTDWISAIAQTIAALGLVLLWWQVLLLKKQTRDDHERSRRQCAIELLLRWNDFERTEGHLAIAIAERMDVDCATAVWSGKPTRLPSKFKGTLERFLARQGDKKSLAREGEDVRLSEENSLELRSGMIECMNLLETIFSAARHNVADIGMIEEQFGPLIDPDVSLHRSMMRIIRGVAGGSGSFPSTSEFDERIMSRKRAKNPGKEIVGA